MPNTSQASVMVLKCFSAAELVYLGAKPEFALAVSRMLSLNDFEKVSELGQHLLDLQDQPIREALIGRPASRPTPNPQN